MSCVNRDLDHILSINVIVAAAVTIHRAHFVATAVLATVGPVCVSIFLMKRCPAMCWLSIFLRCPFLCSPKNPEIKEQA